MKDKIEYLNDRYDEDEERAYSGWGRDPQGRWENTNEGNSVMTPRAILADIAAKRAVVAMAEEIESMAQAIEGEWGVASDIEGDDVLDALLQPYADRKDFPQEWRS